MKVKEYLNKVAYKSTIQMNNKTSEVYKSKYDDSYITHVGSENDVSNLAEKEITMELTNGVGYSPKYKKWFGWSHRAIYGFKIGSTCKIGDCHYRAECEEQELKAAIKFWSDEEHTNVKAKVVRSGKIMVTWEYSDAVTSKSLCGSTGGTSWYYQHKNPGRGEWVAETMEDAKQMAMDFKKGVS